MLKLWLIDGSMSFMMVDGLVSSMELIMLVFDNGYYGYYYSYYYGYFKTTPWLVTVVTVVTAKVPNIWNSPSGPSAGSLANRPIGGWRWTKPALNLLSQSKVNHQ